MDGPTIVYACLVLLATRILVKWYSDPLRCIPTIGGPSFPLLSYLAVVRFAWYPDDVLQEGYKRYQGSAFKVALPYRWMIVVSGPDGVEDLRRRSDSELSISAGADELFQRVLILGGRFSDNRWHIDVIKSLLTGLNLPSVLAELLEELPLAVQDNIPWAEEWTKLDVRPSILNIVARLNNRVFVGLPMCRSQAYLDLAVRFAVARISEQNIMKVIPPLLRPIIACFIKETRSTFLEGMTYIESLTRARRMNMERFGNDWRNRPNDLLQRYMEEATELDMSDEAVVAKLFITNFAAIHTTSMSMTNALYDLAMFPKCMVSLRAEVEEFITSDGWTKAAIDKMWKVDSFLRESQRWNSVARFALTRMAMRDLTLIDGTFIPKGTIIATAISPPHRDQTYYPRADVFDPFRFSRTLEEKGVSAAQAFTHTSAKWLAFGHGKHACPGRFFAADQLKALISYLIVTYDIKVDDLDGAPDRAGSLTFRGTGKARTHRRIMIRKRKSD